MTVEIKIKQARIKKNITQSQLAKRIGVHVQFMSNCERGRRTMPIKYFKKISVALGIPLQEMVEARASDIRQQLILDVC